MLWEKINSIERAIRYLDTQKTEGEVRNVHVSLHIFLLLNIKGGENFWLWEVCRQLVWVEPTNKNSNTFFTEQICYSPTNLYNATHLSKSVQDEKWIAKPTGCPLHAIPVQSPLMSLSSPSKSKKSLYNKEEAYKRQITGKSCISLCFLRLLMPPRYIVDIFHSRCCRERWIPSISLSTPMFLYEHYQQHTSNLL